MKAIIGTILFALFIVIVVAATYIYIKAMNEKVEAPIRAKGFESYHEYRRYIMRRRRKVRRQIARAKPQPDTETVSDDATEERRMQKMRKQEEKKLADEIYLRELNKRRGKR